MSEHYEILKNAAECGRCGNVVESKYRHDFRYCSCKGIFVDGGRAYLRRGCDPDVEMIERSECDPPGEWEKPKGKDGDV